MTNTHTLEQDSAVDRIFGPVIQPQTWMNLLYLVASFPLGILYFVSLVTLFAAGVGLLPIFVGFFVLWAGLTASGAFGELDRQMLNVMLKAGIPPIPPAPAPAESSLKSRMLATARRPGTLTRILYLFLRFPIGIISFVLVMTLAPVSLTLLTVPLTYGVLPVNFGASRIETFEEAIYVCCFGAVFSILSVHALNSWAAVCRRLGQKMLG